MVTLKSTNISKSLNAKMMLVGFFSQMLSIKIFGRSETCVCMWDSRRWGVHWKATELEKQVTERDTGNSLL